VEYATLQDGPTGLGIRYKPGIGIITQVISPKKQADVEGMTRGCKVNFALLTPIQTRE
jgi:hypothetical protein